MNQLRSRTSGQTIVEILVATAVVAVVLVTIAAGLTLSVKNTAESKYRTLAISQAQEALEVYRRERNSLGWATFLGIVNSGSYCLNALPDNSTDFANLVTGDCVTEYSLGGTGFRRQADVFVSADEVVVEINLTWLDGDQERNVQVTQEFREIN